MKKLLTLLFGATLVLGLVACSDLTESSASELYVSIDINPSIEFIVDEDGIVTSFLLLYDDAKLLCVNTDFVGMTIDEATELFIQMATEAGFIDVDSDENAVLLTVYGDQSDYSDVVRARLKDRLVKYLARNYINGVVMDEGYTSEEIESAALELGITPAKLKLIYAAQLGDPELTVEQGIETSVKELLAKIRIYHGEEIDNMTDEELAELRLERARLIEAYRARIREHLLANPELTDEQLEARVNFILRQNYAEQLENWENLKEIYEQRIIERRAEFIASLDDNNLPE